MTATITVGAYDQAVPAPDATTPWDETELDVWSALDHKRGMGGRNGGTPIWMAPTWVDVGKHPRRLAAYKVLHAYFRNVARRWLQTDDETIRSDHREYGDPQLLVKAVLAALMGDVQTIAVAGADDETDQKAQDRQEFFDSWAIKERFRAKLLETERNAVKLGDGVYMLTADTAKKRVRLRIFDPGFYFPELDPNAPEDEYPDTVHIAWQYEEPENSGDFFVRRITFRLGPIRPALDIEGRPQLDLNNQLVLIGGDVVDESTGNITRQLPWNDEPSTVTCYQSDGVWKLEDVEGFNVHTLPRSKAEWFTNELGVPYDDLDTGFDFVPVIHVPNTVEIIEHFGESVLSAIAQLFDEIAAGDTDAAAAAALAGVPAVAVKGVGAQALKIKPGAVFNLGMEGSMDVLDLSAALDACMRYVEVLIRRASQNSRVPEEWLGRVKSSDVNSGFQLLLGFSPLRSLIDEMRLVRDEKYPILLAFVQRLSVLYGWLDGDVMDAELILGNFMPTDITSGIERVTNLYGKHLMSRSAALKELLAMGAIDVDIMEELDLCESEDFDAALNLLDATSSSASGDLDAVYELLHRDRPAPEPVVAPVAGFDAAGNPITAPGVPGGQAGFPATPPANPALPVPPT